MSEKNETVEAPTTHEYGNARPRREFVRGIAALTASASLSAYDFRRANAEAILETTRIRLVKGAGLCVAPQYVAEELLYAEGFTNVEYVPETTEIGTSKLVATGDADINMAFALPLIIRVDASEPVVILGGIHVGCYELVVTKHIDEFRDLRNKRVAVPGAGSTHHLYLSTILSYVGVDPRKGVQWVFVSKEEGKQLLADGKVDAYLGFAPEPQELRASGIGRVLLNSSTDSPWSQYFCCMVSGNREFVRKHPVAAKRALRAILKASDLCSSQPEKVARTLVDKGYSRNYEIALAVMKELPYRAWREYNPEDTLRFYALRLHELGMIKSTSKKIIAQGTDWRFWNELKKELKA